MKPIKIKSYTPYEQAEINALRLEAENALSNISLGEKNYLDGLIVKLGKYPEIFGCTIPRVQLRLSELG
ncbi:MAG: hypothetical protein V1648_04825 [Candidatus Aenigmatarchaeota archaeon]